jgi:hypothetical protein
MEIILALPELMSSRGAAFDFGVPGCFHAFIERLVVEGGDQAVDDQAAVVTGERHRLLQDFGNLRIYLRHWVSLCGYFSA